MKGHEIKPNDTQQYSLSQVWERVRVVFSATGYSHLNFKIFSSKPGRLSLAIRIHDKNNNQQFNEQIIHHINITSGENSVRLALQSIQIAPEYLQINKKEIAGVLLYAVHPKQPLIFYLSDIRLD